MLTPEEVKARLKDMNLKAVSRNAGVGYMSIYNLIKGKDSRVSVVQRLSDYLEKRENGQ